MYNGQDWWSTHLRPLHYLVFLAYHHGLNINWDCTSNCDGNLTATWVATMPSTTTGTSDLAPYTYRCFGFALVSHSLMQSWRKSTTGIDGILHCDNIGGVSMGKMIIADRIQQYRTIDQWRRLDANFGRYSNLILAEGHTLALHFWNIWSILFCHIGTTILGTANGPGIPLQATSHVGTLNRFANGLAYIEENQHWAMTSTPWLQTWSLLNLLMIGVDLAYRIAAYHPHLMDGILHLDWRTFLEDQDKLHKSTMGQHFHWFHLRWGFIVVNALCSSFGTTLLAINCVQTHIIASELRCKRDTGIVSHMAVRITDTNLHLAWISTSRLTRSMAWKWHPYFGAHNGTPWMPWGSKWCDDDLQSHHKLAQSSISPYSRDGVADELVPTSLWGIMLSKDGVLSRFSTVIVIQVEDGKWSCVSISIGSIIRSKGCKLGRYSRSASNEPLDSSSNGSWSDG